MNSYGEIETICKLLGDSTRLEMVGALFYNEVCICELVKYFDISQPAISRHIKKLKNTGMLLERKEAQWKHYQINKDYKFYDLIKTIIEMCPKTTLGSTRKCL